MLNDVATVGGALERREKTSKIVNAMDGTVELDEFCLSCVFDSSSPIDCIRYFEVYSLKFPVPISVAVKLQDLIMCILCSESAPDVVDSALAVVSQIAGTYSSTYDFGPLFTQVFSLLPRSSAFNAISSLITSNESILPLVLDNANLELLSNFFRSSDFMAQSGALGVFRSLTFYSDHPLLEPAFASILDFHFRSSGSLRVQSFELLASLLCSPRWYSLVSARLTDLFCVEAGDTAQLIASLRLLSILFRAHPSDSLAIFEQSQGVSLCTAAVNSESDLCKRTGADTLIALLRNKCGGDIVIGSGIASTVLEWRDRSFDLTMRAFTLLCLVFHFGSLDVSRDLFSLGFLDFFLSTFSASLCYGPTAPISLTTLLHVVEYLTSLGSDSTSEIKSNSEIRAAIDSFIEDTELDELRALAAFARHHLFEE